MRTATSTAKWMPKIGHNAVVTRRGSARESWSGVPWQYTASANFQAIAVPATALPVDCTGNLSVQLPLLGDEVYADSGLVMCCHVDQILTHGQGKRSQARIHQ